jgi:hypothetical protein
MKIKGLAAAGLAVVLLAGCGSSGVPWENYDDTLKPRIDAHASAGDCAALQVEFDTAYANNTATRERTGEGNDKLMGYIDDLMRDVGCYD